MKDQHTKITGYRDLNQSEIDAINKVKEQGQKLKAVLEELRELPNVDQRWLAIAGTDFQTGLMAAVRAVARPTTF